MDNKASLRGKALIDDFLDTIMIPNPEGARAFAAPDLRIGFNGGRAMRDPSECGDFNVSRYAWVKKHIERSNMVAGATSEESVVYNIETLYGAWPDGIHLEGNRYVDRYVVRHGRIVQMDVWNDSAEWLLVRAGLSEAWPSPMGNRT